MLPLARLGFQKHQVAWGADIKRKKTVIFSGIILIIAVCAIGLFTQSPKWSQRSFEAIVKETITQPDGETRLIVERTTEIYGNPANSLGISKDTKLLDADGKNISAKDIPSSSSVKVTVKDAFNEETPFYYPVVYEVRLIDSGK